MSLLEEKTPGPSLAMIATMIAVITAVGFGGLWAMTNAGNGAAAHHQTVSSTAHNNES